MYIFSEEATTFPLKVVKKREFFSFNARVFRRLSALRRGKESQLADPRIKRSLPRRAAARQRRCDPPKDPSHRNRRKVRHKHGPNRGVKEGIKSEASYFEWLSARRAGPAYVSGRVEATSRGRKIKDLAILQSDGEISGGMQQGRRESINTWQRADIGLPARGPSGPLRTQSKLNSCY